MSVDFIFPLIWILGVTFSMDEMTMCFKGHHAELIRMMDKARGGELQIYDIFQKGYTYKMFLRNDPVSKTYLSKNISPLDARVM